MVGGHQMSGFHSSDNVELFSPTGGCQHQVHWKKHFVTMLFQVFGQGLNIMAILELFYINFIDLMEAFYFERCFYFYDAFVIYVTPLPFSPVQFQYNCLFVNTIHPQHRSLPSVTYIISLILK